MQAVDGKGAIRVMRLLNAAKIEVRPADENDSRSLFEWRNHPAIRMVSRNREPIAWEAHQAWLAATLSNRDRLLLIGSAGGKAVGVVRFDVHGDEAEVSIYLVPDGGFAGHGLNLLLSAERWLAHHRTGIKRLCAHVLEGNEASRQLFQCAGYHVESVNYLKELQGGS
jgi:RimJ/RimL family protein N-acetyltransferase